MYAYPFEQFCWKESDGPKPSFAWQGTRCIIESTTFGQSSRLDVGTSCIQLIVAHIVHG